MLYHNIGQSIKSAAWAIVPCFSLLTFSTQTNIFMLWSSHASKEAGRLIRSRTWLYHFAISHQTGWSSEPAIRPTQGVAPSLFQLEERHIVGSWKMEILTYVILAFNCTRLHRYTDISPSPYPQRDRHQESGVRCFKP